MFDIPNLLYTAVQSQNAVFAHFQVSRYTGIVAKGLIRRGARHLFKNCRNIHRTLGMLCAERV